MVYYLCEQEVPATKEKGARAMSQYYDIMNEWNEYQASNSFSTSDLTDEEYAAFASLRETIIDMDADDAELMAIGAVIRFHVGEEQAELGPISVAEMQRIRSLVQRVASLRIF
jgi:hypothetical protein